MTLYVLTQELENFQKRLNKMLAKFTFAPEVTYSEPMQKKVTTNVSFNHGWDGRTKYINYINCVEVNIEDVEINEWVLVASLYYTTQQMCMVSSKYFPDIPEQFGFNYTKCDYCGHTHSNRLAAHIIYNKFTNEWMQVGTSCVNKMFNEGKYFSTFTEQLYKICDVCFACMGYESFGGWFARIPDHYMEEALPIDYALAITKEYYDTVSTNWQKSQYDRFSGRHIEGTTNWLNDYYDQIYNSPKAQTLLDPSFLSQVTSFVAGLDSNNEFEKNIMDTFSCGFVNRYGMYTVFFGLKKYMDSLTMSDWDTLKASNPIGNKISVRDAKVVGCTQKDGFYGVSYEYVFEDPNKVKYMKSFSDKSIAEGFKDPATGLYNFAGRVDGYSDFKRCIIIRGRVSSIK